MIESCSKKRMLLAISFLGGLTVLVLIIESHWTDSNNNKPRIQSLENTTSCPQGETHEIVAECHPCSPVEIASGSIAVCVLAKYKETIKCKNGKTIIRSCDRVVWLEERSFWKFVASTFTTSVLSCLAVFWRENILRQRVIRKIARQLRSSV